MTEKSVFSRNRARRVRNSKTIFSVPGVAPFGTDFAQSVFSETQFVDRKIEDKNSIGWSIH